MPAKLRKSRSGNVTKSNNRPASKQSIKRKTPKNNVSKGKARKTTRRRSKRGGASASESEIQKFIESAMTWLADYHNLTSYYKKDKTKQKYETGQGMPDLDFKETLFRKILKNSNIEFNGTTEKENLKSRLKKIGNGLSTGFYSSYYNLEDGSKLKSELSKETHRGLEFDYDELNKLIYNKYGFNPGFSGETKGYRDLGNQVLRYYKKPTVL